MATTLPPGIDLSSSQQPKLQGAILSMWLLAVLAVALRFTSRWLARAGLWWDDWTLLLCLVFANSPDLHGETSTDMRLFFFQQVVATAANLVPLTWSKVFSSMESNSNPSANI
jgi:hypothetical protein